MTTRKYSSRSQQTTLTSAVTSGAVTLPVVSATTLLGGATVSTGQTFTVVIDPDTALEEIVDVTVVSGNNLTITRAVDMAGGSAQDHSSGAVVRHMVIGRDLREANLHIEATGGYNDGTGTHLLHGVSSTSAVVGTYETQTLYNKTLVAPTLTSTLENDAGITFEGSTADTFETLLTVVDPTQDNTISLPNTSGTVGIIDAVQTLTNKTITSPTINGTPVITGLSSTGMSTTSATPKNYVDSILGSATAASTSAASAAVSATSSATSASAALTSANSASASATSAAASAATATTQATAATTSATSAAASATAAATSAASAATSASAASTSATSAAASATTAAASVASIATYASNALASQNAASTSATSASASATAAATSATSAAASATTASASASTATTQAAAAVISASSAAASATAAATSATSAAVSATAAATSASSALTSQTAAATSATSAAASATAAATSATSAAASATAAATSATSAATSASSSLTTYNTYKTYYLGSFASAPTLDNQGNALITGATYFNSGSSIMYVYSGSAWNAISSATSYSAPVLGSTTINSGTTYANVTGLTINSTTIPTSKTLVVTTDKLSVHAATTSAELAGVISDETGSGLLVFATSPTLTTPVLGVATATSINGTTVPTSKTLVVTTDKLSVHAATTSAELAGVISDETGSGALVFGTAPTLNNTVLTGTLTAASSAGTNGQYLQSTATGIQWATVAGYSAPTLGSTSIGSGATVTTINGLTKIVSATHASLDASGYEQDIVLMTLMGAWI